MIIFISIFLPIYSPCVDHYVNSWCVVDTAIGKHHSRWQLANRRSFAAVMATVTGSPLHWSPTAD